MTTPETIPVSSAWRKWALHALEALLVLVIVALLIAIWLPAWFGGQPGLSHGP